MTRAKFLNDLYHHLYGLTQEQAEQHLTYYAEMLADRMEEGMSEEEAVAGMEDVETIARRIMEEEGLPYTPPEQRPPVPPVYPDAAKLGGGNQFTRAYQVPKQWGWRKIAQTVLLGVAIIAIFMVLSANLIDHLHRSTSTDTAISEVPPIPDVPVAEAAPYTDGWEYMEMPYNEGYEYTEGENYLDSSMVEGIDIEWAAGMVYIQSWGGDGVQIQEYSQSELNERTRMEFSQDGNVLCVRYRSGSGLLNVRGSKWLTVLVPEGLMGEIDVSTISANVMVQGTEMDTLRVSTTSGMVTAIECYTQTTDLSSVSGEIMAQQLWADQLDISTTSGDISGEVFAKKVSVSSISGDITLDGLENAEMIGASTTSGDIYIYSANTALQSIKADSASGDVSLSLPSDLGFTLDYSTVSGNISISNFDVEMRDGTYVRKGGECSIDVDTTSGDLSIY